MLEVNQSSNMNTSTIINIEHNSSGLFGWKTDLSFQVYMTVSTINHML